MVCSGAILRNHLSEKRGKFETVVTYTFSVYCQFSFGFIECLCLCYRLNRSHEELTPISWNNYFEHKRVVEVDGNKFTTYSLGNVESVLIVLLHGGGFNALTWSLFSVRVLKYYSSMLLALILCQFLGEFY